MRVFISDKEVRRGASIAGLMRLRREPHIGGGGWEYVPINQWLAYWLYERALDAKWRFYELLWNVGLFEPHEMIASSWRDISPCPWRGRRRTRTGFC